jgi:hypothetical protein
VGIAFQGASVSISGDGNTAVLGGPGDDKVGAAWVFARSNGVWSQQGPKLIGTRARGPAQGASVSVCADGNTVVVGRLGDDDGVGAAWVFIRSGGIWSQQGPILVGTGSVAVALLGASVSISGYGNTAVLGGPGDDKVGAAWVFTERVPAR